MQLVSLYTIGGVARYDISSLKWIYYGPKRDILEYWETLIFSLLSYYILSTDKVL